MGFEYIFEGEEWENTIFYYILLIFSFFLLKNLHGNVQDTFEEKAHNIKEFVDLLKWDYIHWLSVLIDWLWLYCLDINRKYHLSLDESSIVMTCGAAGGLNIILNIMNV